MNGPSKFVARPDPVVVFSARCEARAHLWREGELGRHEAVDVLQTAAERDGLVAKLGQDRVQASIAAAFHTAPIVAASNDAIEIPAGVQIVEIVAEQPRSLRAAESTVEALMYALRQGGTAALAERDTRSRLAELSTMQVREVIARLIVLCPRYQAITDELIFLLGKQL
jgi:hypothetical protein